MLQYQENIELRKKTSFRLGKEVPYFYNLTKKEDLVYLVEAEKEIGLPIKILGGGSNVLVADASLNSKRYLDFAVAKVQIHYENEDKFEEYFVWQDDELCPPLARKSLKEKLTDKALRLKVGAGLNIAALLKNCAKAGASGLEGLAGVPGKVGGAIAMNAGAYGCEVADVLESVEIYDKNHGYLTLNRLNFTNSYRKFNVFYENTKLEDYIILGASFVFPAIERQLVQKRIDENLDSKKQGQPIKAYSAGCIFKNPMIDGKTVSAGKILDELGLKGFEKDGIRFSKVHANFLENLGTGNTKTVLEMMDMAKEKVFRSYNIQLENEVMLWL